ncbi:hypothetical protein QBC34DRAFT_395029 [Podospora aff. communis PSN243]|uniref:Uncharacterized protein n=1 Tax=Podospora aff. communis PSN243 TaxID=3040156 RepID=A0AAV9H1G9_9PEZI|nr:hypothetical protein QBC34DRAFT_395029 [Podospora aff. communis PSN243]
MWMTDDLQHPLGRQVVIGRVRSKHNVHLSATRLAAIAPPLQRVTGGGLACARPPLPSRPRWFCLSGLWPPARGTDSRAFLPFPFGGNPKARGTNPTPGPAGPKKLIREHRLVASSVSCSQRLEICGNRAHCSFLPRSNGVWKHACCSLRSPLTQREAKKEQTKCAKNRRAREWRERGKGGPVKLPSGKLSWLLAMERRRRLECPSDVGSAPTPPGLAGVERVSLAAGMEADGHRIPRGSTEAVVNRNC